MRLIPAEVVSWDGKELRVKIQGYTDGASKSLKADVLYPFGDRPSRTGFRILPGDAVWVLFNGGEIDNPIVVGFRNKNTGGNKDVRLFTHKNFFLEIDENTTVQCPDTIYTGNVLIKGNLIVEGMVNVTGGISGGSGMSVTGNVSVSDGDISVNGSISATGTIHADGNITSSGSITDSDGDGGA